MSAPSLSAAHPIYAWWPIASTAAPPDRFVRIIDGVICWVDRSPARVRLAAHVMWMGLRADRAGRAPHMHMSGMTVRRARLEWDPDQEECTVLTSMRVMPQPDGTAVWGDPTLPLGALPLPTSEAAWRRDVAEVEAHLERFGVHAPTINGTRPEVVSSVVDIPTPVVDILSPLWAERLTADIAVGRLPVGPHPEDPTQTVVGAALEEVRRSLDRDHDQWAGVEQVPRMAASNTGVLWMTAAALAGAAGGLTSAERHQLAAPVMIGPAVPPLLTALAARFDLRTGLADTALEGLRGPKRI